MKTIILILMLFAATVFAQEGKVGEVAESKIDIALAIEKLAPKADYSGSVTTNTKEAYDKIEWKSETPKPTWEELQAVSVVIKAEQDTAKEKEKNKKKVDKEVRRIAIESLKAKGDIPANYTEE